MPEEPLGNGVLCWNIVGVCPCLVQIDFFENNNKNKKIRSREFRVVDYAKVGYVTPDDCMKRESVCSRNSLENI